tara:strand:+ start:1265 stop:1555 length:291 start_codon:yes stop_codon:yes gene_type:complete
MARERLIISYDIADPKRLRSIARTLESYGWRIQYSVFECPLSAKKKAELLAQLAEQINHREDQVLILSLGNEATSKSNAIQSIGKNYGKNHKISIF